MTAPPYSVINRTRGRTAALIASLHRCNNSSPFSEIIIGENPWLLSQVHYIMPASQSASRPPLTLSAISPLCDSRRCVFFFLFLPQSITMSTTHTNCTGYIHHHQHPTPLISPVVQSWRYKEGTAENHLEPAGIGQCRSPQYRRQQCAYSQFIPLLSEEARAADQWQLQSLRARASSGLP